MSKDSEFRVDQFISLEEAEASEEIEPGLFTGTDEPVVGDELSPQLQPTSHKELALNGLKSAAEIAKLSFRVAQAAPEIGRQIVKSIRYELDI